MLEKLPLYILLGILLGIAKTLHLLNKSNYQMYNLNLNINV